MASVSIYEIYELASVMCCFGALVWSLGFWIPQLCDYGFDPHTASRSKTPCCMSFFDSGLRVQGA